VVAVVAVEFVVAVVVEAVVVIVGFGFVIVGFVVGFEVLVVVEAVVVIVGFGFVIVVEQGVMAVFLLLVLYLQVLFLFLTDFSFQILEILQIF